MTTRREGILSIYMIYMYTYTYGTEISFIKFDVAIATLNNLLTMAVLKKASK